MITSTIAFPALAATCRLSPWPSLSPPSPAGREPDRVAIRVQESSNADEKGYQHDGNDDANRYVGVMASIARELAGNEVGHTGLGVRAEPRI